MVDKVGRRAGFVLTPGNAYEPHWLSGLLDGAPANEPIADKAYDTNAALALLAEAQGITAVIPSSREPASAAPVCPRGVYGMRHLVENRFAAIPSRGFGGLRPGTASGR